MTSCLSERENVIYCFFFQKMGNEIWPSTFQGGSGIRSSLPERGGHNILTLYLSERVIWFFMFRKERGRFDLLPFRGGVTFDLLFWEGENGNWHDTVERGREREWDLIPSYSQRGWGFIVYLSEWEWDLTFYVPVMVEVGVIFLFPIERGTRELALYCTFQQEQRRRMACYLLPTI